MSTVSGERPPFFSALQSGTRPGRALAMELMVGPRRQLGHEESLSMLRGERWNEWPFSQRHHTGRKLRTRTAVAAPFFLSSQSLLSCGLSPIESAMVFSPPSRTGRFDAVVTRPAWIARVEPFWHTRALNLPACRLVLGYELVELK